MAKRLNIVEEKFLDTIKNNNLINSIISSVKIPQMMNNLWKTIAKKMV